MPEPIEQRIVDNVLGALRTTATNGVEEGQPPVDPRERELPWTWVMFEETERVDGSTKHTQLTLVATAMTIFACEEDARAYRIARMIRAEQEAALLSDERRGLTNPQTTIEPHNLLAGTENLWALELPATITFQHLRGNPWDEGV